MPCNRYLMRDLNGRKIDQIMDFNVAQRRSRSRSVVEISIFLGALAAYLTMLAISA
jgi:hypothetical protein